LAVGFWLKKENKEETMAAKQGRAFYELEIYQRYETISDLLWDIVDKWSPRHQELIGDQMLRAVDSVGANIAEAVGRGHFKESLHHLFYGRGSLAETQHWIRRAVRRKMLDPEQVETLRQSTITLYKQLNAFIRSQRPDYSSSARKMAASKCSEPPAPYARFRRKGARSQKPKAKSRGPRAGRSMESFA
jgi:four helix bundle protein